MTSSRELLEALRAARADETVVGVLNSPVSGWRNMNQSPPRALMRDQVDARETAGVRKWLTYHQQQLEMSEKRRLGNRLKAQEAFEQSQAELEALHRELERSHVLAAGGDGKSERGKALGSRNLSPKGQAATPLRGRNTEPQHVAQREPSPSGRRRNSTPHRRAEDSAVRSDPPIHSISEVRDINLLKQAVADRDAIIDRLQKKAASDRSFYQSQLARLREDFEAANVHANARVTGLRSQLEASLLHNRSIAMGDHTGEAGDRGGLSRGEQAAIETKIAELQGLFSEATSVLQEQTTARVSLHTKQMERRVEDLRTASELAISAAKEIFRADRLAVSTATKEEILTELTRRQNEAITAAVQSISKSVESELSNRANQVIQEATREELNTRGTIPMLENFLTHEVKKRVSLAMDDELNSIVKKHMDEVKSALARHTEEAKQEVLYAVADEIGIDVRGIDHVLNSTQAEFKALRHAAEAANNKHELEHHAFMAKARHVLDRIGETTQVKQRYVAVEAALAQ